MKLDTFINGITQGFLAPRGYFNTPEAEESTARLIGLGVNFVALVVNQFQETFASTRIFPDNVRTVDDTELTAQIRRLHDAGIKVMLKPMLEPLDSIWRGLIHQDRGNIIAETRTDTVTPWFASYREFMRRYAVIAEATKCEMFCIGCELDGMDYHRPEWEEIIRFVRGLYSGIVTYNMTMKIEEFPDNRRWMSQLDLVGISGYFKVSPKGRTATRAEMCEGWKRWRDKLATFHEWIGRPLFFAETGTRPVVGAGGVTGDFADDHLQYSEEEQADYYSSTLDVLAPEPWFYGTMWWKHDEHQHRPNYYLSDGHYIGCEPAELLRRRMREWCARPTPSRDAIEPAQMK